MNSRPGKTSTVNISDATGSNLLGKTLVALLYLVTNSRIENIGQYSISSEEIRNVIELFLSASASLLKPYPRFLPLQLR